MSSVSFCPTNADEVDGKLTNDGIVRSINAVIFDGVALTPFCFPLKYVFEEFIFDTILLLLRIERHFCFQIISIESNTK